MLGKKWIERTFWKVERLIHVDPTEMHLGAGEKETDAFSVADVSWDHTTLKSSTKDLQSMFATYWKKWKVNVFK